jgi:hypothetical protein
LRHPGRAVRFAANRAACRTAVAPSGFVDEFESQVAGGQNGLRTNRSFLSKKYNNMNHVLSKIFNGDGAYRI